MALARFSTLSRRHEMVSSSGRLFRDGRRTKPFTGSRTPDPKRPLGLDSAKGYLGAIRFSRQRWPTDEVLLPMDYPAFTNDSLTMMYEAIRGALASDDAQTVEGHQPRFRVRDTPGWRAHAANLESEMLRRGMFFEVIDWSEDQARMRY
jgi:hypothetical protein